MKRQWSKAEKLLFLAPFLLLAFYIFNSIYTRSVFRHPLYLLSLAFSPDGKTLATGCGDNITRLWNVETGALEATFEAANINTDAVLFSPDGNTLISASSEFEAANEVHAWNRQTHAPIRNFKREGLLALSPNGKILADGGVGIKLYDTSTGTLIKSFGVSDAAVRAIVFSPDGKFIRIADGRNKVKTFDVKTGKQISSFSYSKNYTQRLAFSPDDKLVATGGPDDEDPDAGFKLDTTIKLWNLKTGKRIKKWLIKDAGIAALAFSPNSRVLVTGLVNEHADSTLKLWNVQKGTLIRSIQISGSIEVMAISPDGKKVATGSGDGRVQMWDM